MFTSQRTEDNRLIRLTVTRTHDGWEMRQEQDNAVIRVTHLNDWHRVERRIQMFEQGVSLERA